MSIEDRCPECGESLPRDAPQGFCPACLVRVGAGWERGLRDRQEAPGDASSAASSVATGNGPTQFGGYELLEELGRGGMGVVYRARESALNRMVAIKMLLHGRFSDPAFVERFHLEAEAAAHLEHPNIVPIYEIGQHEGQSFYSMRLIEGRSLAQLNAECRTQNGERGVQNAEWSRRSAELVATIARAVQYAHERGVLHRDIKPHNILLDAQGQPYLTDFGLAKLLGQESGLTISAGVIGSPEFMAPEQASGKTHQITTAADIYGLGGVLYALLTGKPVFHANTPLETMRRVLEAEPTRPRAINLAVDRDLETICLKCLQKEPAKRYASAQALAEDLECWLNAEPIQARPATALERVWLWCRRQPVRAGLSAGLFQALAVGLTGILWQWNRARAGELRARHNAYAADMSLVQVALDKGDLAGALSLLNRQRPLPGQKDLRGWEWRHFWQSCQSEERFLLCKYRPLVGTVAFSPDANWLALRVQGGGVALWDVRSRKPLLELLVDGNYKALALSPRGDLLAYGTKTNDVAVLSFYDITQKREIAALPCSAPITSCVFSPDGSLLGAWAEDGLVSIWKTSPPQLLTNILAAKPQGSGLGRIRFSPAGQYVAIAQPKSILLWDWTLGRQRSIPTHDLGSPLTTTCFSRDGKFLAVAASGFRILDVTGVWNLPLDAEVPIFGESATHDWTVDLAFSPDGKMLVTAEKDPRIALWDFKTLKKIRSFRGNTHQVLSVLFSPDGKDLVSGAADGSVRFWDPAAEWEMPSPAVLPMPVWAPAFAFTPDSQGFIALDNRDGVASLWSISPLRQLQQLSFLGTNNSTIRFSPEGRMLAVGNRDGSIRIWDYANRNLITNFLIRAGYPGVLKFNLCGRTLFCGSMVPGGRAGQFWDTRTWRDLPLPPDWPTDNVRWAAVSPDNATLAALDGEGTVTWWQLGSRQKVAEFKNHFASASGYLDFSPAGDLLAGSGKDGVTTLWDVHSRRIFTSFQGNFRAVHGVAFSPDGQRLLSGGEDAGDVVRLLDLGSGRHVATLAGPSEQYWRLEISPDGNTLTAGGISKTTLLWHAPSWAEIEAAEKDRRMQPSESNTFLVSPE